MAGELFGDVSAVQHGTWSINQLERRGGDLQAGALEKLGSDGAEGYLGGAIKRANRKVWTGGGNRV